MLRGKMLALLLCLVSCSRPHLDARERSLHRALSSLERVVVCVVYLAVCVIALNRPPIRLKECATSPEYDDDDDGCTRRKRTHIHTQKDVETESNLNSNYSASLGLHYFSYRIGCTHALPRPGSCVRVQCRDRCRGSSTAHTHTNTAYMTDKSFSRTFPLLNPSPKDSALVLTCR